MSKVKSAFDWKGEPSIYSTDKKLRQSAIGKINSISAKERINLIEKKEFTIYSKAKLKNDS